MKLICFVDKGDPPNHSFVDGMLGGAYPKKYKEDTVLIFCSGNSKPRRHNNAILLPKLYTRRGINRFINFFLVRYFCLLLKKRYERRGNEVVLFVRNEPIYLLAANMYKGKSKFIFQNSFAFEIDAKLFDLKKQVAKFIYKITRPDEILVVSEKAIDRSKHNFKNIRHTVIPLLYDFEVPETKREPIQDLRMVYIGTHSPLRRIDVVFDALLCLDKDGVDFIFHTYGGTPDDRKLLLASGKYNSLIEKKKLVLFGQVDRKLIPEKLMNYNLGVCVIPVTEMFLELSPTKLVEYLGSGLATIASYGIPLQEEIVNDSKGGYLCEFSEEAIYSQIKSISQNIDELNYKGQLGKEYVLNNLRYENYVDMFRDVLIR